MEDSWENWRKETQPQPNLNGSKGTAKPTMGKGGSKVEKKKPTKTDAELAAIAKKKEELEAALPPAGCLPQSEFWLLSRGKRAKYRHQLRTNMGYIPQVYSYPREVDKERARALREATEARGMEVPAPPVLTGEAFRENQRRAQQEESQNQGK